MTDSALNTFQQISHPIFPDATADELSRQEFVKSLKSYIQSDILPGLKLSYDVRSAPAYAEENGELPKDRWAVRKAMKHDPYFQGYVSLQRISQELMWRYVYFRFPISKNGRCKSLCYDFIGGKSGAPKKYGRRSCNQLS